MQQLIIKYKLPIIGIAATLGLGTLTYFLFFRKKGKADKHGNRKIHATGKDATISGGLSGGIQTSKQKANTLSEPDWNNPFDMNYEQDVKAWIHPKRVYTLKKEYASQLASQLKKAKGGWLDDNEEAVYDVFAKKIKSKVHVANLSKAFWNDHKKDMWEHLKSFLSNSEMEKYVHAPVRKLPNYKTIN